MLDDVEELAGVNTTAEQMARFIFSQVFRPLKEVEGSVEYLKVTVWENQSGFASFKDWM
ncbi:MAG TPA: 6-carboxytetrahydropterin synthase [Nitrososphaerales archaeon]|nr:6-carboxytetrahydropterin synthase [Nitrososphaerales archaeon]